MIKGYVNGVEKDITRVAMPINDVDKAWEVRAQEGTILWGADKTLTGVSTISFKGYGLPLKSCTIKGNGFQNGTPTPDAPIMLQGCGDRTGNLFDGVYENGYITASGTYNAPDSTTHTAIIECMPNTHYYIKQYAPVGNKFRIATYTAKPVNGSQGIVVISDDSKTSYDFTTGNDVKYIAVYVDYSNTPKSPKMSVTTDGYHDAFIGYLAYVVSITCGGVTNTVYLGQTPTVRKIRKMVLTGNETWYTGTDNFYILISTSPGVPFSPAICTHAKNSSVNNTGNALLIRKADFPNASTAADFKAFLATQYAAGTPVTVWYVLAEPETAIVNEPLCKIDDYADELHSTDAGVSIPTVKGSNTLTVDTDLPPSAISITGHIKPIANS